MEVLCDSESSTARCLAARSPSAAGSETSDHQDVLDDTVRSSSTDSELGQLTCNSDYSSSEDEEEEDDEEAGDLTTATAGNSAYGCYGGEDEPDTDKDTERAADETDGEGSSNGEVTSRDYSELIEERFKKLYGLETPVNCRVLDEEWCDQIFLPVNTVTGCNVNSSDRVAKDDETSPSKCQTSAEGGETLEMVCSSWPANYRSQQGITNETLKSEVDFSLEKSNEKFEDNNRSSTDTDSENDGQFIENFTVDIDAEQQNYTSKGYKMTKDSQMIDSSNWSSEWDMGEDQFDHPFRFLCLINKLAAMNDLVVVSNLMDASSHENKPCFGYRRTPVERCIIEEIEENSDNENADTQKILVNNVTSDSVMTSICPVAQKMKNDKHKTAVETESTDKDIHFNVLAQSRPQPEYKNIINESVHEADENTVNNCSFMYNDSTNHCRSSSRKGRDRSSPRNLKCCHRLSKSDGDSCIHTKNFEPVSKKHTLSGKIQVNKSSDCNCQLDGGKTTIKLVHRSLKKTPTEHGELDTSLCSKGQTSAEARRHKKGTACQKQMANNSSTKDQASTTQPSTTKLPFIKTTQLDGTAQLHTSSMLLNTGKHYEEVLAAYKPKGRSAVRGLQSQKQSLLGRLLTLPTKKQNGSTLAVRLPSLVEQPAPAHRRSHPLAIRRPSTPPNRNVLESRAQWPQFSTKQPCQVEDGTTSKRINFRDMPSLKKVPGFSYGVYE